MKYSNRIYKPSVRKRIAYWTAFRVAMSYLFLYLKSWFWGKAYYERNISALHLKNANLIKEKIVLLQGLFVKFGQLISILSNILPDEFRAPLEALQDKNPPRPYEEVAGVIQKELGAAPKNIFTTFDTEPIASASIGQVHRATIEGREVVVKVQHSNIEEIAKADLAIQRYLVSLWAFFWNMKGIEHSYEQVKLMIDDELNYKKEADSMKLVASNLKSLKSLKIRVPEVLEQYSTQKVMTCEYCEGINIGNIEGIEAWNINRTDLAKRLTSVYCQMIIADGFYHADPHPGNILVNRKGEIILIDFGATAQLSTQVKDAIPKLIDAIIKNDTEKIIDGLQLMGFVGRGKDAEEIAERLVVTFRDFLENEVQIEGLNIKDIKLNSGLESLGTLLKQIDLSEVFKTIQIPKDWVLLNRAIVLLMGTTFHLAPEFDTLTVVKPYLQEHIAKGKEGISQMILNSIKNQITTSIALPNELQKYLKKANKGVLKYEIKNLDKSVQLIYALGQQFLFLTLTLAGIYFTRHIDKALHPNWHKIGIGLIFIAIFLFLKAWWRGKKIRF